MNERIETQKEISAIKDHYEDKSHKRKVELATLRYKQSDALMSKRNKHAVTRFTERVKLLKLKK